MSEIKGQILGIIIVLMIFGVVSGAMVALFTNLSNSVTEKVEDITSDEEKNEMLTYVEE